MKTIAILVVLLIAHVNPGHSQPGDFIEVKDGQFYRGEEKYLFLGANYWYGMYLGMAEAPGDRSRLIRELDHLQSLGIKNLRILGSSEGNGKYQIVPTLLDAAGNYNEAVFEGLDFFLQELSKRDMTAVVVLNNFWMWSGGMPQYVSWAEGSEIPLPDIEGGGTWDPFINYALKFYNSNKAQKMYRRHLKKIINRTNTFSGITYKNDPTILSWQLANEPRGYTESEAYHKWIKKTSAFINRKDRNHMISLGAEGNTSTEASGVDLYLDNDFRALDYATVHVWIQNWSWFDPADTATFKKAVAQSDQYLMDQLDKAAQLGKPVVIEEFGVSRDDGDFVHASSTSFRDRYYAHIFKFTYQAMLAEGLIQGCNFWAWAGEGRPALPGGMWQEDHDLIGDPPHERQGWYSVYDTDDSTIEIIKNYASKINLLQK